MYFNIPTSKAAMVAFFGVLLETQLAICMYSSEICLMLLWYRWLQFMQVIAEAITAMGIRPTLIGILVRLLCRYPIAMTPSIVNMMYSLDKYLVWCNSIRNEIAYMSKCAIPQEINRVISRFWFTIVDDFMNVDILWAIRLPSNGCE